ncbi:MAG: hypothetical protein ACPIOQ_80265, partial [Promethearchaeia archaeon]
MPKGPAIGRGESAWCELHAWGSQTLYFMNSLALGLSTAFSRPSTVRPAPMLARLRVNLTHGAGLLFHRAAVRAVATGCCHWPSLAFCT